MSFLTSILFRKEISRPVFILGCGRSGTTILGKTLAEHRDITYLNERRDLWSEAYPQTNIWTGDVSTRGRMCLAGEDAERSRSKKLRRLFHRESLKTSRPVLVEKLPINNFRLEFINEIFPDARFVHIYRNGLEVARSIQTLSDQGHWYKFNHYKWDQLKQLAQKDAVTSDIPEMCNSYFRQGLFEWRLSSESAVNFLAGITPDRYLEISYAQFTSEPVDTIKRVLSFIEIDHDDAVIIFTRKNIARKTPGLDSMSPSKEELKIGGQLLPLSMDSVCRSLTEAQINQSANIDSKGLTLPDY